MSLQIRPDCFVLAALLLAFSIQPGMAQDAQSQQTQTPFVDGSSTLQQSSTRQQFGGPNSVPGQLAEEARIAETLGDRTRFQNYFDWKDCLREKRGLSFSVDYTSVLIGASNTLNAEDAFSGGAARFFGSWTLTGRDTDDTGSFIWKVENRHKYTDVPPSGVASEIGYAGLVMPVISDQGTRLTNFYWKQNLRDGRWEIIVA